MNVLDMFGLDGKVAVVTGAHAWLGYDMACALAEAACNVIATSRDWARARRTAEKLRDEYGIETLGLAMDQRFHDQVTEERCGGHRMALLRIIWSSPFS